MSGHRKSANASRNLAASSGLLALLAVVGCSDRSGDLQRYRQVGDFNLIERSGESFARTNLVGKIWIANFFFAGCSTECSLILTRMATIQERIQSLTNVVLVSFTTDPRSDTPEALTKFAAQFDADPERWFFLTGDRKQILRTVVHDFLLPVTKDYRAQADLLSGLVHSDQLVLVDATNTVRAYFDGLNPDTPDRVMLAIQQLHQETPTTPSSPPPEP